MIRKGVVLFLTFALIFGCVGVLAQDGVDDALGLVPEGDKVAELIDDEGRVKGVEETKEKIDEYREQDSEYLRKELTEVFATNKYVSGFLDFIEKIFSFFNPLWKIALGAEFSWTWSFVFLGFFFISSLVLIYFPVRVFTNFLYSGIISFLMSVLFGYFGLFVIITKFFESWISNFWIVLVVLCLIILILAGYTSALVHYRTVLKEGEKKMREEKFRRDADTAGKLANVVRN